jgi:CRP-like cAMP-binding protein
MDGVRTSLEEVLQQMGWPAEAAASLARGAHVVAYEKDAIIYHAGEPADVLYILLSGEAKLYYGGQDGDRLLAAIVRSGESFGVFDPRSEVGEEEGAQTFSAQALSRCKVAIIGRPRVARAIHGLDPDAIVAVVGHLQGRWAQLCRRVLDLLGMNVRERLAYTILEIAGAFGIPDARGKLIRLKLSHEDFGDLVAASRPMVSKHLKDLARAGIFSKQNGRYVLSREEPLRRRPELPAATRSGGNLVHLRPPAVGALAVTAAQPRRRASR